MTQNEMIKKISISMGIPREKTRKIYNMIFDTIVYEVKKNGKFKIFNFGTFFKKTVQPRRMLHIIKKQIVILPMSMKMSFRQSKTIKNNFKQTIT